jgi:hypothetical protein
MRWMKYVGLLVFGLLLVGAGNSLEASSANLEMYIPKVAEPVVDGILNDATWLNASTQGSKYIIDLSHMAEKISSTPRIGYVGYNTSGLYVAFVVFAPNLQKLVINQPSWWNNDAVEVFVNIPGSSAIYELGVISTGYASDSNVKVAMVKSGIKWTVEVIIPWSSFGTGMPKFGDVWNMNLCGRQIATGDMWVAYNTTYGKFANPAKMARAVFGQ